jgi:hypothetical protein
LNQFCLTPNAILNQAAPWSGLKAFPWTRVKTVTTTCRPYQRDNTWFGDYELTLDNGRDITLSSQTTVGLWEPAYPLIARALHGHSFTFDRSRAETECPLRMFTQRP